MPDPTGLRFPLPPRLCPSLLRHHYCKLADLSSGHGRSTLSGPPQVQGLGRTLPKNPRLGDKRPGKRRACVEPLLGRSWLAKGPPGPCLGRTFMVSALSPPTTRRRHRETLQQVDTRKAKGFSGNPQILTEVSHQDSPATRALANPLPTLEPLSEERDGAQGVNMK